MPTDSDLYSQPTSSGNMLTIPNVLTEINATPTDTTSTGTDVSTTYPSSGTSSATSLSPEQILQNQLSWALPIYAHYLGHDPSYRDLLEIQKRGLNPDTLTQQIRAQGSYIPGITIGQLEDYHTNSQKTFMDWLGREPTDEDIRDIHNRGLVDPQQIDEYVRNREDVMSLHPGAPLGLQDTDYQLQKNAIDSAYLQNLGRISTHEEARGGIQSRAKGPSPVQETQLQTDYKQGENEGLNARNIIAPNARNFA